MDLRDYDDDEKYILRYIDRHPIIPKEGYIDNIRKPARKKPARKKRSGGFLLADDEKDLHGYTVDEAVFEAGKFIEECRKKGAGIIRIIHGTRQGDSPLKSGIRTFLSSRTGASVKRWFPEPGNDGSVIIEI
ncbi:MAG: Smr/MutS family protein [Fibrobacterota bacterium]